MADDELPAGRFSSWVADMQAMLGRGTDADVPCAGCTACCTSSMFVHVEPDETDALAHIPKELQFPAPFLPAGHVVLPYDERGRCPMLADDGCSIYEHRPRTCRRYDCRFLAAARIDVADERKSAIRDRVRRWRFTFATDEERAEYDAIGRAASFLRAHPEVFAPDNPPADAQQLALLAFDVRELFASADAAPSADAVRAVATRR